MLKKLIISVFLLSHCIVMAQTTSPTKILDTSIENDFFFYIDRYYTSGVTISLTNNNLKKLPFYKVLIPGNGDKSYYSIGITHHMYTPERTYTPYIQYRDYTYAAYLLLGLTKENYNYYPKSHILSKIDVGVLGPLAMGEPFQNTIHNTFNVGKASEGWDNQIKNDICLQYTVVYEKGIINTPYFELIGSLGGMLGVPHTQAHVGAFSRVGIFSDYFRGKSIDINRKGLQGWLIFSAYAAFVNYNATLQGGTVNQESPYTISDINKAVYTTKIGGQIQYNALSFSVTANFMSPEFKYAFWHRWITLGLSIRL